MVERGREVNGGFIVEEMRIWGRGGVHNGENPDGPTTVIRPSSVVKKPSP